MKKYLSRIVTSLLALAFVLSLCGCGSSSNGYYSSAAKTDDYSYYESSASVAPGYGYDGGFYPEEDYYYEETADDVAPAPSLPANVKLIYTANVSAESTEYDKALSSIESLVYSKGGYFENWSTSNYSTYRNLDCTIRVPADTFEEVCSSFGGFCNVKTMSKDSKDVSEAYYDLESRMVTARTKLERLQKLLSEAEKMEDIITLESAISETELYIENLTGSLRKYDSLIGYSTINLSLREVYKETETEKPVIGFGAKLTNALGRSIENFKDGCEDLLIDLAYNWIGWLIFIVIVVVIIVIVKKLIRKSRRERGLPEKKGRKNKKGQPIGQPLPKDFVIPGAEENKNEDNQ